MWTKRKIEICFLAIFFLNSVDFAASQLVVPQEEWNFRTFVKNSLSGYNFWAEGQSLNSPYLVKRPEIAMFPSCSLFNLYMTIFNMTITSGLVANDAYYFEATDADTRLTDGQIRFSIRIPSVEATGSYRANGELLGRNVSTTGTWKITFGMTLSYVLEFNVEGNYLVQKSSSINGDGRANVEGEELPSLTIGGLFDGSEDGNIKNLVLWKIGSSIGNELAYESRDALTDPFNIYFGPILSGTPITDMIRIQSQWNNGTQDGSTEPPVNKALRTEISVFVIILVLVQFSFGLIWQF